MMDYRREIDGLRALAVVAVIFFHAGFSTFSGGFVGVDVFFVISGYLITSIIIADIQTGKFSFIDFYERRARRILPALFFVMATCIPFAWFWLPPEDLRFFSQSGMAVATFVSNVFFRHHSGYFDTQTELNPLLHTWSLAVEEQYYVIFPIICLFALKFGKRWLVVLLVLLALISFALAEWASVKKPAAAFFLFPARGWELLLGCFIAFYFIQKPKAISSEVGSLIGLALIAFAVFTFDSQTPFPGVFALVPTVGTVLIILFATPQTYVGQWLGSRMLVMVGLLSYSAYLWHQPLFAFLRNISTEEPGMPTLVLLILATFLLAYVSWKFVETPARNRQKVSRKQIFVFCGLSTIAFVGLGAWGYLEKGFENRLTAEERDLMAYRNHPNKNAAGAGNCFLEEDQPYTDFSACATKNVAGAQMIWGDSHAAALSYGLRQTLPALSQYTASNCQPLKGVKVNGRQHCQRINEYVLDEISRLKPTRLYLLGDWTSPKKQVLLDGLQKTITQVKLISPMTEITIIGGLPQWYPTLPTSILRKGMRLNGTHYLQSPIFDNLSALDITLNEIAKAEKLEFFSAIKALCIENKCQATVSYEGEIAPTAWDNVHFTKGGSHLLATKLLQR